MANKSNRRRFGLIRRLPSGRYQASYQGPDGMRHTAPSTFGTKGDASAWLTRVEADLSRGTWSDPRLAKIPFGEYAVSWIDQRPGLRPRTVELYRWLYERYLSDRLARVRVGDVDPGLVRAWRAGLIDSGVSVTMTAKAYRLLRAILMTATDDGIIARNPCRIRRAGAESPTERPVLTVPQVFALADGMPARFRALVLVATFASLRFGEVTALQRRDVDLARATVRVRQAFTEVKGKGLQLGPPKSVAGRRVVSVPAAIVADLAEHLAAFVGTDPAALVFAGVKGGPIRRGNFNKLTSWPQAVATIGAPGLHFHDLRHTGNTLAADSGASTRNLMARMGHDSMNAALIYQHASSAADRAIAQAVDALLQRERNTGSDEDDEGSGGGSGPDELIAR